MVDPSDVLDSMAIDLPTGRRLLGLTSEGEANLSTSTGNSTRVADVIVEEVTDLVKPPDPCWLLQSVENTHWRVIKEGILIFTRQSKAIQYVLNLSITSWVVEMEWSRFVELASSNSHEWAVIDFEDDSDIARRIKLQSTT